jgi:hypothetical protein
VDNDLKHFVRQWLGVVAGALFVVFFIAFCSMPLALGFHPGEAVDRVNSSSSSLHMT